MIDQTPRQTSAVALEETVCVEVERNDIMVLLQRREVFGPKGLEDSAQG